MKQTIILLAIIAIFASCSKDLEGLNKNTKDATTASGESFFAYAEKGMADVLQDLTYGANSTPFSLTRQFSQQISDNTYNDGTNYRGQFSWSAVYQNVLKNLDESKKNIEAIATIDAAGAKKKQNELAIIEVMNVYAYGRLVEAFGNIPYTEALLIDDVTPKYDDAKTVYTDLITRLNAAISKLDPTGASFGTFDILYKGSVDSWIKFANSLKLQMGLRIIDAIPALGTETVTSAIPNVFTANAQNAEFKYLDAQPNTNPLWVDLAVGNRQDFIAAEAIVNQMNAFNDPRLSVYFTKVGSAYIGAPYAQPVEYNQYSHFGDLFYTPTVPAIFIDYATVEFLLAEAAERGIASAPADAAAHYNKAIRASFEYYHVTGADAYLAQPLVAYQTATGPWKRKIGIQKWIALFNQGSEAWTEYRRLDYPVLQAPPGAFVNIVPTRLLYPTEEQTLNRANYTAASTAIGNDLLTTKLFWDIN